MDPTDQELSAYLDEMLPAERAAEVERALRDRADLRQRAALLARRRDQGGHTVGEIWRRQRLSCPTRADWGSYILGVADPTLEEYAEFHLRVIGCPLCEANLADLRMAEAASRPDQHSRRQRYFESSAGLLRSGKSHQ